MYHAGPCDRAKRVWPPSELHPHLCWVGLPPRHSPVNPFAAAACDLTIADPLSSELLTLTEPCSLDEGGGLCNSFSQLCQVLLYVTIGLATTKCWWSSGKGTGRTATHGAIVRNQTTRHTPGQPSIRGPTWGSCHHRWWSSVWFGKTCTIETRKSTPETPTLVPIPPCHPLPCCDTRMIVYLTRLVVFPQVAVIKTGDKVKQLPELVLVEGGRGNNSQPRHTLGVTINKSQFSGILEHCFGVVSHVSFKATHKCLEYSESPLKHKFSNH
ncbi:hypothetical protein E2C01_020326 [Portunus trituberculatus]|uniref:Uncharacterized protein n=1 Tax=Portunus trituberculatus TaxID=210409 RepID=A0A5B7DZK9_PORTR|nr:hypothetical protein [Portunus trituberculatus]